MVVYDINYESITSFILPPNCNSDEKAAMELIQLHGLDTFLSARPDFLLKAQTPELFPPSSQPLMSKAHLYNSRLMSAQRSGLCFSYLTPKPLFTTSTLRLSPLPWPQLFLKAKQPAPSTQLILSPTEVCTEDCEEFPSGNVGLIPSYIRPSTKNTDRSALR